MILETIKKVKKMVTLKYNWESFRITTERNLSVKIQLKERVATFA